MPPKTLNNFKMRTNNENYFEQVYLEKKNEKVSVSENKRLQKLLSVKAFNRAGDSVRMDLSTFRPIKKVETNSADLNLLIEGFDGI